MLIWHSLLCCLSIILIKISEEYLIILKDGLHLMKSRIILGEVLLIVRLSWFTFVETRSKCLYAGYRKLLVSFVYLKKYEEA